LTTFLQLVISGLLVGSVYAIVALGFVLIYKASGVLNFAQGEFLLFSSFFLWTMLVPLHLPIVLSFFLTTVFAIFLGLVVERLSLRPLIGQPIISLLMVTLGLSALLRGVVMLIWGGRVENYPAILPTHTYTFYGITISVLHIWAFILAMSLMAIFAIFFRFHRMGLAMRASAEDHQVARSVGVNITTVFALSWVIASLVSAVGGFLLGSISGVSPMVSAMGLKVLTVVLFGGMESILGSAIAGPFIGVLENLAGGYMDPIVGSGAKEVAPFVILILILLVKPYGLFGLKRIERI
jgi:branched-chain amino acid transport system permease protein